MKAIRHFNFGERTPKKEERNEWHDAKTVVVENCPSASDLKKIVAQQLENGRPIEFPLQVGIARLHPNDQYNKKIGVKVATEKAKNAYYYLTFSNAVKDGNVRLTAKFQAVDPKNTCAVIHLRVDYRSDYPEISLIIVNPDEKVVP